MDETPQWTLMERLATYYRVWRCKEVARMDHRLWLHWAIFGRYPRDRKHKEAGK